VFESGTWSSISALEVTCDSLYITTGRPPTVGLDCNDSRLYNSRQNMLGSDTVLVCLEMRWSILNP
jgi:hypothetical protein